MQISMAFITAYRLAAGEAAIADFAYSAKHLCINMGTMMPARRARGPNEPGGIPFGFMADMAQSDRVHFTRAGYQLCGNLLYNALIEAYINNTKRRR